MKARTPDYYALLDVVPEATYEEIHAAYRALAQSHHPDHDSGSTKRMIALNEAWAVLREAPSRAKYDRRRASAALARAASEAQAAAAAGSQFRASEREAGEEGSPGQAADAQAETAFEARPLARRWVATKPAGPVLDFGSYAGWSLADVARRDPDYLAWLAAPPVGRSLAAARRPRRGSTPGWPPEGLPG